MAKISRRLGVFFFYDAEGVVDRYVEVMLDDMTKSLSELVVVSNGPLTPESYAKLAHFTDNIIVRENKGLDVWAYKTALDSYGWESLSTFDEVILFNATIMGPVYPFAEMFAEMDSRETDFWGITWFHQANFDPFGTTPEGFIPRHIQSHFMAYRKSLVTSKAFQDYWNNIPEINNYADSVGMHEAPFTRRFERLGFTSDVYINTDDMEGITLHPLMFAAKEMVAQRRCPIFKRRSFFHDYDDVVSQTVGNDALDLYEYLRDHTDYDTNLIWENALRTTNLTDLVRNMQLTYVLPSSFSTPAPQERKLALVLHVYYLDILDKTLAYAKTMPEGSDLIITVGSDDKVAAVTEACKGLPYNVEVRKIENRGRDVSALLVGVRDIIDRYDYVCFAHDKKVTQLWPQSKGEGFAYKCFENILASKDFVRNVVAQFDKEPRLGMLMPTPPNHAEYYAPYAFSWGPNFDSTKLVLDDLGIKVNLTPEKEPIAPLGTMFWFRPEALKPLFDAGWGYDSFPPEPNNIDGTLLHAIERAYAYVAQGSGYFSGWLFSDRFARIELTNLSYYVQGLTREVDKHWARGTFAYTMNVMREGIGPQQWVKKTLKRTIPQRFHAPLRGAYVRLRKFV